MVHGSVALQFFGGCSSDWHQLECFWAVDRATGLGNLDKLGDTRHGETRIIGLGFHVQPLRNLIVIGYVSVNTKTCIRVKLGS